jgi:hypothetical protein
MMTPHQTGQNLTIAQKLKQAEAVTNPKIGGKGGFDEGSSKLRKFRKQLIWALRVRDEPPQLFSRSFPHRACSSLRPQLVRKFGLLLLGLGCVLCLTHSSTKRCNVDVTVKKVGVTLQGNRVDASARNHIPFFVYQFCIVVEYDAASSSHGI